MLLPSELLGTIVQIAAVLSTGSPSNNLASIPHGNTTISDVILLEFNVGDLMRFWYLNATGEVNNNTAATIRSAVSGSNWFADIEDGGVVADHTNAYNWIFEGTDDEYIYRIKDNDSGQYWTSVGTVNSTVTLSTNDDDTTIWYINPVHVN